MSKKNTAPADERITALREEIKRLKAENAALQLKAAYYDTVLNCPAYISTTRLAKELGLSTRKLYDFLQLKKVIVRTEDGYEVAARKAGMGLTGTKTTILAHSTGAITAQAGFMWTERGRIYVTKLWNDHVKEAERGGEDDSQA